MALIKSIKTGYWNFHGDDSNGQLYVTGTVDNPQVHWVPAGSASNFRAEHNDECYYFADVYNNGKLYVITNDGLYIHADDEPAQDTAIRHVARAYFVRDMQRASQGREAFEAQGCY